MRPHPMKGFISELAERLYDRYGDGTLCTTKGIGAFWALQADALDRERLDRMVAHLSDTTEFDRPHRVPSLSADHPKYNPLDQDVKLKDAIDKAETKAEKDSIRDYSQDRTVIKSVSFNNVRVNIKSKNPMPYDPANFTLGYSYSINDKKNPETEYETTKDYRANFAYSYVPYVKPIKPFDKLLKKNNGYTR